MIKYLIIIYNMPVTNVCSNIEYQLKKILAMLIKY